MAWKMNTGPKHTCNDGCGPSFGRLAAQGDCPRCDELRAGAAPRQWAKTSSQLLCEAIQLHFASHHHKSGGCGPVCTFGDW